MVTFAQLPKLLYFMYPLRRFTLFGFILFSAQLQAQDLHFSQFYLHPVHLTPAATGVFEGKARVGAIYRSQWQSVPVAYETFGVAVDYKALQRGKSLVSVGLLLQKDQAGDAQLDWTQGGLNIAVAHTLGQNSSISLGFGVSAVQRTVDISHLSFKNQWSSDFYDPTLPTKEPFGRSSGWAPSLSSGLLWHYQAADSRTQVNAGVGAFHLNRTVVSLGGVSDSRLPLRAAFMGEGIFQLRENLDFIAFSAVQSMKKAKEVVLGAGIRSVLSTGMANFSAIRFSLASRLNDAIIPAIQLERNNWLLGISYDINTSPFNEASNGKGGIEIAAIYRWVPVQVSKAVNCCPVF